MVKKRLLLIVSFVALLFIGAWFASRLVVPSIEVVRPVRGPAVYAVYATGTVEATVMLPIAPRSSARLMGLGVDEGSKVTKGQILARLEDSDLQKSIAQFRARETYAHNNYIRSSLLAQKNFISKDEVDRIKSDWLATKAAMEAAEIQASYLTLIAPADGYIIQRDGEIGQLIPVNQPVFWLSCCAPLRISTEVDEEDIAQVQPGQQVLIRADAFPGKIFHGTVQSITPKGDPIARSYRVRVGFAKEVPLQIGMTAETNIIIRQHQDALLLPVSTVENNTVWLVKEGRLKQQPVTIGAKGPEQIEIEHGVKDNDSVALKPDSSFKVGKSVRTTLKQQGK